MTCRGQNPRECDADRLMEWSHELERRLAEIIGYCAQEGCDGEPYDTINKIARGEYSTRGGGSD